MMNGELADNNQAVFAQRCSWLPVESRKLNFRPLYVTGRYAYLSELGYSYPDSAKSIVINTRHPLTLTSVRIVNTIRCKLIIH